MKHVTLITSFVLLTAYVSYGQKTEYSAHLNSGGFAYRGASVGAGSTLPISDTGGSLFDGSYSNRLGFSYGLAVEIQRITSKHSLFGVQAGYEVLRNQAVIKEVVGFRFRESASGYIKVNNQVVNVHPFFGHRFTSKTIALDLAAGPEVGLLCRSHLVADIITTNGNTYAGELDRDYPKLDVRARLNLAAYYKHIGLTLGYSRGLTNYYNSSAYGSREVYSQIFRAGLAYRI